MLFYVHAPHRDLHSFPTRRSSDLVAFELHALHGHFLARIHAVGARVIEQQLVELLPLHLEGIAELRIDRAFEAEDRKSTRLNSSHLVISYAVFCLKKKKTKRDEHH